jgi:uncharacterized protein (TIGR03437 family)
VNGIITLKWTPGGGPINELQVGLPGGPTVVATALGRPLFSTGSIVNAASFRPGLSPGAIATVFGASLAGDVNPDVRINGTPAQVFYANPRQVNFFVPFGIAAGSAEVVIRTAAGASQSVPAPVHSVLPGVFFDAGSGYGAVMVAGTGQVTQVRPAGRGETIEIYSTGLGAVASESGRLNPTLAKPEVSIGGMPAEVTSADLPLVSLAYTRSTLSCRQALLRAPGDCYSP